MEEYRAGIDGRGSKSGLKMNQEATGTKLKSTAEGNGRGRSTGMMETLDADAWDGLFVGLLKISAPLSIVH